LQILIINRVGVLGSGLHSPLPPRFSIRKHTCAFKRKQTFFLQGVGKNCAHFRIVEIESVCFDVQVAYEQRRIFFCYFRQTLPWVPEDFFFLIDTAGSQRSRVNEEKNNLWSQEYATSFPCEKSVQNFDWILPCQVVKCSQSGPLLYY